MRNFLDTIRSFIGSSASLRSFLLTLGVLLSVSGWGNTVTVSQNGFISIGNRCILAAQSDPNNMGFQIIPHVDFVLTNNNRNHYYSSEGYLRIGDNNNLTLSWENLESGYTILVQEVTISLTKDYTWGGTHYVELGINGESSNSYAKQAWGATVTEERQLSISNLNYGESKAIPIHTQEVQYTLKSITITYDITPIAPTRIIESSTLPRTTNLSNPHYFILSEVFSYAYSNVLNHAPIQYEVRTENPGSSYNITGDGKFYATQEGIYTIYAKIPAIANCHEEAVSESCVITVQDRANPTFSSTFADKYDVDHDALSLTDIWTNNGDGSTAYTIVSFTPLGENNEGATRPYIDNDNKLYLGQAGIVKLKSAHTGGDMYNDGEDEVEVVIHKRTPELFFSGIGLTWSSITDNPFSSTNEDYDRSPLVVIPVNPNLATWDEEKKQIVAFAGDEASVSFKVRQEENYKYLPAEEREFTFSFGPSTDEDCYVVELQSGEEYNILNPDFKNLCSWEQETEDVADTLFFNAKSNDTFNHGINIFQTIDGYDYRVDYINSSVGTSWKADLFYKSLDPSAKKVWFKANNTNGDRYIKDLKVKRRTFISVSDNEISFPTILPNTSFDRSAVIHWSCCSGGDIHIVSSNSKFRVNPQTISTGSCASSATPITITYNPTEICRQDEAEITIYNSTHKATIHVTGNTAQTKGEGAAISEDVPEGTFKWNPTSSPYNWNDPKNWLVFSNGKYYETNSAPLANSTVKIPQGLNYYPAIQDGDICHQIYVEAGGRIHDQYKLKYEEAFADVEVYNNRYSRITPPLQNIYSGDLFTTWQGGNWENVFSPASYNGVEGKSGPNRAFNSQGYGQTYISLFATPAEVIDTYGTTSYQVKLLDSEEGWTSPTNGLGQRFSVSEAFDVWMDNDNEPTSTFHFPSNDKSYYYFISQTGNYGDVETINRDKILGQGRFAYDMTNTTSGGLMEQVFKHSDLITDAYPMFAIGNPSLAFMDVKEFMRQNVSQGYITPFFYKNNEVPNGRGTETIYYYHNPTSSLFRVQSFDVNHNPISTTDENYKVTDIYVNPNEGFRVMAGETEVYSAAYELVGCYSSENCYYRYHGVHVIKTDITDRDYVQAGGNDSERIRNISFAISADSDDPFKVWISNFVGRGYVEGTINPVDHTIRIKNGTPVYQVSTDNEWSDTRILRVYGATSHRLKFGERFYYHGNKGETYKVENISPLSEDGIGDVIIDYDINQSTHKVTLTLRDPFALYSESFAKGVAGVMEVSGQYTNTHTPMVGSQIKEECEAFFVYDAFHAQRTYRDPSDNFILPKALGEYKTPIESKYGNIDIEETLIPAKNNGDDSNYETTQPSAYFDNIKMRRMTGSYDLVLIKGIYPGDTQCSIIGQIIQENDKYKLLIPGGQKVHDDGTDDKYNDYYLYLCHEGDMGYMAKTIELEWNGNDEWQQTLQDNRSISAWTIPNLFGDDWQIGRYYYSSQISHLSDIVGHDGVRLAYHEKYNASDVFSGKFHIYDRFTLTRISDDQGIEEANSSSDPSKENKLEVRYTKDMFKANKPNNNAYAPQRIVSEQDSLENDLIFISATTQNGFHANTLLVVEEKAQKGFNAKEDAPLFDVTNARFSFATLAGSQLVGVNVFNDWDSIPLFISQSAALWFRNIEQLGEDVVLLDAVNNTYVPLYNDAQIALSVSVGEEAGRFYICHMPTTSNEATSIGGVPENESWHPVAYSPAKGRIVFNACTNDMVGVELFTLAGSKVDSGTGYMTFAFNNLLPGVYIVRAKKNQQERQIKVLVY